MLHAWLDYLGIGSGAPVKLDSYFTNAIHGMQKAGYATDPQYAKKLISIMRQIA